MPGVRIRIRSVAFLCFMGLWIGFSELAIHPSLSAISDQGPAEPLAPKPSAAVQPLLDEAARLVDAKQPEDALKAGDRALSAAREMNDPVGEALAH